MLSRRGSDRHTFTRHAPIASLLLLLPSPVFFPAAASSPPHWLHWSEAGCYLKHGPTLVYLPSHSAVRAAAFGFLRLLHGLFQAFGLRTLNWGDSTASGRVLVVSQCPADVCKLPVCSHFFTLWKDACTDARGRFQSRSRTCEQYHSIKVHFNGGVQAPNSSRYHSQGGLARRPR